MCSLAVSPGVYQQLYGTDFPSCFLSVISLYVQGPGDSSFRYLPQKAVTLFPLLCCAPPHLCLLQDQVLGGHRKKQWVLPLSFGNVAPLIREESSSSLVFQALWALTVATRDLFTAPGVRAGGFSQSFLSAWKPTYGSSLPTPLQKPKHRQGLLLSC